jgi:hypothetical protein
MTTYTQLIQDVQLYAEREDTPFVTQIPRLISLAENRLASEIRNLGHLRAVTFDLVSGNGVYEKPVRWRQTNSLSILVDGERKFIQQRSYEYCRVYLGDSAVFDVPEYYADYDYEHFIIVKYPDDVYQAELTYYERPDPLSESNQTNWTTQYAPQLLLYATLLEAQPFLKLSDRLAEFQAMYDRAAGALQKEGTMRMTDNSAIRSPK